MMTKLEYLNELETHIVKAKDDFSYFIKHIYPLSFKANQIVKAPHTFKWAERIQSNRLTATLSARKHLKSNTMYAWVMWRLFKLKENERGLYMSYNQKMSTYHTENIKLLIQFNPLFRGFIDKTHGQSTLDYEVNGNRFICEPSGILTFNRGWHGGWVVCDDILQDPASELNFGIIDKITRIFMEQVMSLPKEGGELHLVGTAQHAQDLFFKLKDNTSWNWQENKAIINEKDEVVLWKELFNYKRLQEIRRDIGDKAFNREYLCFPVWSEDAYFKRDELLRVVNSEEIKRPGAEWKAGEFIAGLDIGKKAHPSHFTIFQRRNGVYTQFFQVFMDGWDYTKQINYINELIDYYVIDLIRFDATRGEFDSFMEQGIISNRIWQPVIFGTKVKFQMAANFSKHVNNQTVKLLNHQRMLDSVLSVNNDLQAPETEIGHGDAFWSIAMALYDEPMGGGYIAG